MSNDALITIVIILIIVFGGWYIVSQSNVEPVSGEPIVIGTVLPMTAIAANYGELVKIN